MWDEIRKMKPIERRPDGELFRLTPKQARRVWQQVQPATETTPEMKLPVWKVMQNDGTFCTFLIANKKAQCVITNEGTFRLTSDSTFVEHIKRQQEQSRRRSY